MVRMPQKYNYRPFVLLAGMLLLLINPTFGQALVENAMASIRTWIIVILNVAFLIGIAIGIFKAAMKFFTGAPDKIEFMIGMVIAIALFGGFQPACRQAGLSSTIWPHSWAEISFWTPDG